jgi:hypothetical protein
MAKIRFTSEHLVHIFPEVEHIDLLPRKKKKALKKKIASEISILVSRLITEDFNTRS